MHFCGQHVLIWYIGSVLAAGQWETGNGKCGTCLKVSSRSCQQIFNWSPQLMLTHIIHIMASPPTHLCLGPCSHYWWLQLVLYSAIYTYKSWGVVSAAKSEQSDYFIYDLSTHSKCLNDSWLPMCTCVKTAVNHLHDWNVESRWDLTTAHMYVCL